MGSDVSLFRCGFFAFFRFIVDNFFFDSRLNGWSFYGFFYQFIGHGGPPCAF